MSDNRWKYINYGTDKPYKVYTLNPWKTSALFIAQQHRYLFEISSPFD
jgi:hypothetical protein